MDLLHSSGDVVELLEEPLDASSDRLPVLLKALDLGHRVLVLFSELVNFQLECFDTFFCGSPGGALRLQQFDRTQHPLLQGAEVIGGE